MGGAYDAIGPDKADWAVDVAQGNARSAPRKPLDAGAVSIARAGEHPEQLAPQVVLAIRFTREHEHVAVSDRPKTDSSAS